MIEKNISAEVSWLDREIKRFKETGRLIPERQEKLYTSIGREFAAGRTCIDIGCSCGVGANILSHEARFVWGIDINEEAVAFAKKAFKRPNLDFEVVDIENTPTRELARFEMITMIEILEHLEHPDQALNNIKRFFQPETIGFITIPNVANEEVRENEAKHGFHLSHWTAGDLYQMMNEHFNAVTLYSVDKLDGFGIDATVDGNSKDYLILAKVEGIK
jgi:2-polyprenyl-3-methyl-5-hydroxy-6-metoxy-1,4-benzoquinol methylase